MKIKNKFKKNFLCHNWLVYLINERCVKESLSYIKGKLLDIGCGNKPYLYIMESYINNYIGIEHPNTLHKNKEIDLYGDTCNLPFKNNSFDTVVSFQVMEHVNEPNQMVAEIYRVIKKDGYVVLTVPFMWGIHEPPYDYYRYTEYGLRYLFEKHKFEIVELRANTGFWVVTGLRFNYYLLRFCKWYLKYMLFPIFFIVQFGSIILDKIYKVESDTASYTLVARKK